MLLKNITARLTKLSEVLYLIVKHLQIWEIVPADSFWKSDHVTFHIELFYIFLFPEDRINLVSWVIVWEQLFWSDLPVWNKDWKREAKGKACFVFCCCFAVFKSTRIILPHSYCSCSCRHSWSSSFLLTWTPAPLAIWFGVGRKGRLNVNRENKYLKITCKEIMNLPH